MSLFPTEVATPGPEHRESEFFPDPAQAGRWITGACGPTMLAALIWKATGVPTHPYQVLDLMRQSPALCDANGVSNTSQLAAGLARWAAQQKRANPQQALQLYSSASGGDTWTGWQAFLQRALPLGPVGVELAYGQALRDWNTGKGENATNLRYHYIALYRYLPANGSRPEGFLAADGDNYDLGDVLQFYPLSVLAAAKPCSAIALRALMPASSSPSSTGGTMPGTPPGWSDDGSTLRAPAPHDAPITLGFRDLVRSQSWFAALQPLAPAYGIGNGQMRQDCALSLAWDGHTLSLAPAPALVHQDQLDAVNTRLSDAVNQLTAARAQVTDLTNALNSANARVADLEAQLTAAQAAAPAPAPAPVPDPVSQEAELALALVRNAVILVASLARTDSAVNAVLTAIPAEPLP